MDFGMILFLAVGLSMDAFAVSLTNGMCYRIPVAKNAAYSGLAFGLFQGMMPLIGYYAGITFSGIVERYDHWLALFLLGAIGIRMIVEAVKGMKENENGCYVKPFTFKTLLVQAVATSIDALAIGVGLGVMKVNILFAVLTIGLVTFVFSFSGVIIGKTFGKLLKEKAEILGGVILVFIGIKIFVEHMAGSGKIGF